MENPAGGSGDGGDGKGGDDGGKGPDTPPMELRVVFDSYGRCAPEKAGRHTTRPAAAPPRSAMRARSLLRL
eukprot:4305194-Prymnesium_polylepis.1